MCSRLTEPAIRPCASLMPHRCRSACTPIFHLHFIPISNEPRSGPITRRPPKLESVTRSLILFARRAQLDGGLRNGTSASSRRTVQSPLVSHDRCLARTFTFQQVFWLQLFLLHRSVNHRHVLLFVICTSIACTNDIDAVPPLVHST